MKPLGIALIAGGVLLYPALSKKASPFAGRWDITVTTPNGSYPDWMEFTEEGGEPKVRVQPRAGSVHPASDVKVNGDHLSLVAAKASENRPATTWDLTVKDGRLTGTQKRGDAAAGEISGEHAPLLHRKPPKAWSQPEALFDGKDLNGWVPDRPNANHWVAKDGVLLNEQHGANLRTTRKFDDFKLHIEFNCPQDGNSGIYLRGRYEVQVEYEPVDANDQLHTIGAIYGFLGPSVQLPRKPGTWESFDITLVGRNVTIVRDGVTTINNQEIPGITGGALDSHEAEPGPFYIQGDHTGGMMYRNIRVSVPAR